MRLPMKSANKYYRDMYKLIKAMHSHLMTLYYTDVVGIIKEYYKQVEDLKMATNASKTAVGLKSKLEALLADTQQDIAKEVMGTRVKVAALFNKRVVGRMAKQFVEGISREGKQLMVDEIAKAIKKPKKKVASINPLKGDKGLNKIATGAIGDNVKLIKSIPKQYFKRVEKSIYNGLTSGKSTAAIAEDLKDIYEITDRRAKFIAIDQLGSINGDIVKQRQENLGLKYFIWLTSEDGKVRPSHAELNEKKFTWEHGAEVDGEDIWPGTDFRCRCTSEMDVSELENLFEDI